MHMHHQFNSQFFMIPKQVAARFKPTTKPEFENRNDKDINNYIDNYAESPAYNAPLDRIYAKVMDCNDEAIESMIDSLTNFLTGWTDAHAKEADRRIYYLQRLLDIRKERRIKK